MIGWFSALGQAALGELRSTQKEIYADAGVFALTGQDTVLRASRVASAGTGVFTLTGQNAGLSISMPASVGSFVLSGQDAALIATRLLYGETGTFALTGQDAGLSIAIPAEAGVFTLTGQDVLFHLTRAILAGAGSFVLTGQSAGLAVAYTLDARTGQCVLMGQAARLIWSGASAPSFSDMLKKPANPLIANPKTGVLNKEWELHLQALVERINALNPNMLIR